MFASGARAPRPEYRLIDSHCHLDIAAFDADREQVIARAVTAGVSGILVPAIRPATWEALHGLVRAGIRIAIGIHPQAVPELAADELPAGMSCDQLAARIADATRDARAIAIGECGLDGATGERELQEMIFRAHIRAAHLTHLPLVVHVLRAHDRAPIILREERAAGGVLHSYSGGAELVPVYRDLGFAFSFAGPVTYPNARRPLEAARAVPDELLLAETDAPDQAPASRRGGRSEPAYLPEIVAGLAAARGQPVEEVARRTAENARRIFGEFAT